MVAVFALIGQAFLKPRSQTLVTPTLSLSESHRGPFQLARVLNFLSV